MITLSLPGCMLSACSNAQGLCCWIFIPPDGLSICSYAAEFCGPCMPCTVCSADQFEVVVCGLDFQDRGCKQCVACQAGVSYETSPCVGTNDRVCTPVAQCQSTEYELKAPTLKDNRICAAVRMCKTDEWESEAPTRTSDRVCQKVTPCSSTQFIRREKSPTSDQVCQDCQVWRARP